MFQIRNPFQGRFVEELLVRASAAGYGLALEPVTDDRTTDTVVAELMEQRVEAIIAFNPDQGSSVLREAIDRMPVVLLGEWARLSAVDNVHVDEERGLLQAVEHLVTLGHTRIAYVGGIGADLGPQRAEAYRAAMSAFGRRERAVIIPSDFSEESGADAARSVLTMSDDRPTALICCGDQCATGVLAVFARSRVSVPRDVSVIGFDDSYLASLSYQQLTSVHQDVGATVEATMGCVLARLSGEDAPVQRIATSTRLVVRTTTGAPVR
ncbi:substrate-binding domain-containing protein [Curtobacterium sp. ISL-83]|uniref:LacI family DNA-binding transcriptional regulator n=1 Tax=Curtobacterium sp. ISL-83 TaxID=2819145 RepID=UPI0027E0C2C9|nr:substrate-binding domain-containing protein [Curtobacterium sp. ISL-83]